MARFKEMVPSPAISYDFELDDFQKKQLEQLGLWDKKVEDDPYSLVSRKK